MTPEEILDKNIEEHGKHIPYSEKNDFYKKLETTQRAIILESMRQYAGSQNNEIQGNLNDAIDLLDECRLQFEYLSNKFGKTGTTENVLARLTTFIKS